MRGFEWTRRRVALTGAAALGMMVMACETPAPSAVEVDLAPQAEAEIEDGLHTQGSGGLEGAVVRGTLRLRQKSEDDGEAAPGEPLIVVDGVIQNRGRLSDINPENIERIEVVKGEAARTHYGERGENGVVQIYTKGFEEIEVPVVLQEVREGPVVEGVATKVIREMKTRAGGALFRLEGPTDEAGPVVEGRRYDEVSIVEVREKRRPGGVN